MDIRKVPVGQLNPAPYNPRRDLQPGDPAYEKLSRSINEFGCVEPIVWNERTGNVVGGHQRLKVLRESGLSEVEASVVDLDPDREKALNLALNKITGSWDDTRLAELLRELEGEDNRDFRELLKEILFQKFDEYFDTPAKRRVADSYRSLFVRMEGMAQPKDYKRVYNGLMSGDPKLRTLRAIYLTIFTEYNKYAKRTSGGGEING